MKLIEIFRIFNLQIHSSMISEFRLKLDVIAQALLILLALLLISTSDRWSPILLLILIGWQIASALHLLYVYQYVKKINFLWTALVLGVSFPVWHNLVDMWACLPVAGLAIWYFVQSLRDWIKVHQRPRSFWDL